MAVINTFPVTLHKRPIGTRGETFTPLPKPSIPLRTVTEGLAAITDKQRYILEWLQSNEGKTRLSLMPQKGSLLSIHSLSQRGLLKVTIELSEAGKSVMGDFSRRERQLSKRAEMENRRQRPAKRKSAAKIMVPYEGGEILLKELVARSGTAIPYSVVRSRVKQKWPLEYALWHAVTNQKNRWSGVRPVMPEEVSLCET